MAAVTTRLCTRPRARRAERGQVLLIVAVMGLLAMGLWVLAWRATHDAIRLERVTVQRDLRAGSVQQALALGLTLLQTGRPPIDPYGCVVTVTHAGDNHTCAVTYSSEGTQDDWTVEAHLATESDIANLPAMPATF